jgi:hypothetical protein
MKRMSTRTSPWSAGVPCWADLATSDVSAAQKFHSAVLGWAFLVPEADDGGYVIASVNGYSGRHRSTAGRSAAARMDGLSRLATFHLGGGEAPLGRTGDEPVPFANCERVEVSAHRVDRSLVVELVVRLHRVSFASDLP